MIFTSEILEQGKSSNNGWNTRQLNVLGEEFKRGWKYRLLGKEFSADIIDNFLALKDYHIKKAEERRAKKAINRKKTEKIRYIKVTQKIPYKEQYLHPNWQRKRLQTLERDGFRCTSCGNNEETLHVHHLKYFKNRYIWDLKLKHLTTLCDTCHKKRHNISELGS